MKLPCLLLILISPLLPAETQTRDPWLWPFSQDSIWNTPLGSNANYQHEGHFQPGAPLKSDTEYHYKISPHAPERPIHEPHGWPVVDGTHGKYLRHMRIDDDIILRTHISNNCAAFLMPDGDHLEQLEPFIRMEKGGIALGIPAPFHGLSLRGEGTVGSHWGSHLSALGGSLRHGHLTAQIPITQALKFNCQGKKYLHYDKNSPTPGYTWPALNADGYAGKSPQQGGYGGSNPDIVMGSLLAIRPEHTAVSLGLKTSPAKLLLAALQTYGAYIVDDSADDSFHFSLSHDAYGEFTETHGYEFNASSESTGMAADWHADISTLISKLSVVTNNKKETPAGGGTPRAPLAPPFGEMDNTPPSIPEIPVVTNTTQLTTTLEWQPSTHPLGISNYYIYSNHKLVGETFGKTHTTVTGLTPGTSQTLTIRARSRSLALSEHSVSVTTRTLPLPPGTVLEDFDSGTANGWRLEENAALRSNRLELHKWDGLATAVLESTKLPPAYTLAADLQSTGTGAGNRTFIHLDYHHFNDTLLIEIPGGGKPLSLVRRLHGKETTLATSKHEWNGSTRFQITVNPARQITLTSYKNDHSTTHLENIPLPEATRNTLALQSLANQTNIDNFSLHPNP